MENDNNLSINSVTMNTIQYILGLSPYVNIGEMHTTVTLLPVTNTTQVREKGTIRGIEQRDGSTFPSEA